jgi:hypothetical protein
MSRSLAITLLAVALVGCNGHSRGTTDLRIVALNPSIGRSEFQLACSPASGDVPQPATSCRAIADQPRLITSPKPFTCMGGPFSWWEIRINGHLNGRPVNRTVSTCWTPQMEMLGRLGLSWDVLTKHLVPRRQKAVLPGTNTVFGGGALRATDLVTCDILGHHLHVGVPIETGQPASSGFGGNDVVTVTLKVTLNPDGSVSASCRRGARGPASRTSHHA